MAEFADRMKSLTESLRSSIESRDAALAHVHEAALDLFERTRAFAGRVADEHRVRAEELQTTMAAHRKECRQKAAELRQDHQRSLTKMRSDLNHMLSQTRATRQDTVKEMSNSFQHARNQLALDLHEASKAWRQFAASR